MGGANRTSLAGPHLPPLAHLVESVEVPFAYVLLKDPRLWRKEQLDSCLGLAPSKGPVPESPGQGRSGVVVDLTMEQALPCEPETSEKVCSCLQGARAGRVSRVGQLCPVPLREARVQPTCLGSW